MKREPKLPTNLPRRLQGEDPRPYVPALPNTFDAVLADAKDCDLFYPEARTAHKEDPLYLEYIASQPCWTQFCVDTNCMGEVVAHHQPAKGRSNKGDDRKTVPLCVQHHREWHDSACMGTVDGGWDHEHCIKEFAIAQITHLCNYLDGK